MENYIFGFEQKITIARKGTMVTITSQHSLYLIDKLRDRVNILTSDHIVTVCALFREKNSFDDYPPKSCIVFYTINRLG